MTSLHFVLPPAVPGFLAVTDPLLPIRVLALVALLAVISTFVYVLRHLQKIERTIRDNDLVPKQPGPQTNVVLIICAAPIAVTLLLVFLVLKA